MNDATDSVERLPLLPTLNQISFAKPSPFRAALAKRRRAVDCSLRAVQQAAADLDGVNLQPLRWNTRINQYRRNGIRFLAGAAWNA
jgi:hypothetical protein